MSYWTGKKRSEETKRKISEAQKGKKGNPKSILAMAEKNREKGKGRQSYNYQQWRRQVLERDENKCVKCGKQHEKMHCDHIVPWKENESLRFEISNGQTLCAGCHIRKGKEFKEIVKDITTRFKKGQISLKKGVKTGKPSWNSGKKGLQVAWNKGKSWTDDVKEKISKSRKGKCIGNTFGFQKDHIPWMAGKKHTEESKKKNSESNKGKIRSPETQFKKGLIPWNKGKKVNGTE